MVRGGWILGVVAACGGSPRAVTIEPPSPPRDESALVTRPSQVPEPVVERAEPELATEEEIRILTSEVPPVAAGEKLPMLHEDRKSVVREPCHAGADAFDEARNLFMQGNYYAAVAKLEPLYRCDPKRDTLRLLVLSACKARHYALAKGYFAKLEPRDRSTMAQMCMPPSFANMP